ncbi:MAG TPA: hypothetical protein VI138_04420 [Candidatus Dormibacteraeota bacterium]
MKWPTLQPVTRVTDRLALLGIGVACALLVSACGSPASSPTPPSRPTSSATASGGAGSSATTIKVARVGTFGKVLVNRQGQSLYTLTSEKGGQLTCTAGNGCTQSWLEVDLGAGVSAATVGPGLEAALLGSEKGATGTVVTWNGWPLYTYIGDSGSGQSHGEGLASYGGTWYLLSPAGTTVRAAAASPSPSSGGGGSSY